jgi:cold shock CspA family protein
MSGGSVLTSNCIPPFPHGQIAELFPQDDYGMITSADGREIYFHRNSLLNADFDKLREGTSVRYVEEAGDKGPQASSVRVESKHHVV